MSLQTIVNRCNSIQIDRRKVVGIQITRNEIPRTSVTPTKNPWRFTLVMPPILKYSDARQILEELDRLDRYQTEIVSFSGNPKLAWIFRYQGGLSSAQLSGITVSSFVGNQLVLDNLPVVGSNFIMFQPNDLIQIGTNNSRPYPFTVVSQVTRGTGSTVTITTSRPNILTGSLTGLPLIVGNACQWRVFCPNMPTYTLLPGGWTTLDGTRIPINNAYIEFSSEFTLMEYVGNA